MSRPFSLAAALLALLLAACDDLFEPKELAACEALVKGWVQERDPAATGDRHITAFQRLSYRRAVAEARDEEGLPVLVTLAMRASTRAAGDLSIGAACRFHVVSESLFGDEIHLNSMVVDGRELDLAWLSNAAARWGITWQYDVYVR